MVLSTIGNTSTVSPHVFKLSINPGVRGESIWGFANGEAHSNADQHGSNNRRHAACGWRRGPSSLRYLTIPLELYLFTNPRSSWLQECWSTVLMMTMMVPPPMASTARLRRGSWLRGTMSTSTQSSHPRSIRSKVGKSCGLAR